MRFEVAYIMVLEHNGTRKKLKNAQSVKTSLCTIHLTQETALEKIAYDIY